MFIFIPAAINLYYVFIRPNGILKNVLRYSIPVALLFNFYNTLGTEFKSFIKLDTPQSNKGRDLIQRLSMETLLIRDYSQDTLNIIGK